MLHCATKNISRVCSFQSKEQDWVAEENYTKIQVRIKIAKVSRVYEKSPSVISFVLVKREVIKEVKAVKIAKVQMKQSLQTIDDDEQLLLICINKNQLKFK